MNLPSMGLAVPARDLYRRDGHVCVYVGVTHRCNLKCGYCFDRFGKDALTLAQAHHVISEVERCDFAHPFYDLSGGEIMVLANWREIIEAFLKTGREVQVNTNGTLIDEDAAEALKDLNGRFPDKMFLSVSLDSHDPAVNSASRPGTSSAKVFSGLKALRDRGLRFRVAITLTSKTRSTIVETVRFVVMNYTREVLVGVIRPVFKMDDEGVRLLVPLSDVHRVKAEVLALRQEIGDFTMYHAFDGNGRVFCTAGLSRLNIEPNGDVTCCYAIQGPEHVVGNLFREPLRGIVERMRQQHSGRDARCLLCEQQAKQWGPVPDELKLGLPERVM